MPVVSPPDHNGSYDSRFIVVRLILFEKKQKNFVFAVIVGHFEVFWWPFFFFSKINTCSFFIVYLAQNKLVPCLASVCGPRDRVGL